MFIDKVRIFLKGGMGGNGCLSFLHDKYVEYGGPDGGSGGRGGSIYLEAEPNITTLVDFTYKPHFKGASGDNGKGKDKQGRSAGDMTIFVPCGTVVLKDGHFIHDLTHPHERILAARGGRGGRGNASFKTHRNTAPRITEKGEPGEETTLDLELKLIADVGLIGMPNAGKSTFLSRVSAARPKIAAYPFTTLAPNLGVVKQYERSFVMADLPGLLEGAHTGKGLGTEFLKHVERTRILVHIIDITGYDGKSAGSSFRLINKELASYGHRLDKKPMIVALNKIDTIPAVRDVDTIVKNLKKILKGKFSFFPISAVTGEGIKPLLDKILKYVSAPEEYKAPMQKKPIMYTFKDDFMVEKIDGLFSVKGRKVEALIAMTPLGQEESVERMQEILKKMGVDKALHKKGVKPGDMVRIGTMEFEWQD